MTRREALRARSAAAVLDVATRLRENARTPNPLPFEDRRDVLDLLLAGYPQTARHVLDDLLTRQGAGA